MRFYARSVHLFRSHPHVLLRRGAWERFQTDFSHTIRRIKKLSSIVEGEADLARVRTEDVKSQEASVFVDDSVAVWHVGGSQGVCRLYKQVQFRCFYFAYSMITWSPTGSLIRRGSARSPFVCLGQISWIMSEKTRPSFAFRPQSTLPFNTYP